MDEYNSGMDPEVKLYFRKIIKSFSAGLLWMMVIVTAGLFFRLGHIRDGIHWYNILFYVVMLISLIYLIRYFYKIWSK
jgi:hypothetical protein